VKYYSLGLLILSISVTAVACSRISQASPSRCTPFVMTQVITKAPIQLKCTQEVSTPTPILKNTSPPPGVPPSLGNFSLILGECAREECLFREDINYPVGIATISGYYTQIERNGFDGSKKCDSFVIVDGSKEIIRSILSLIDEGNGVYLKNDLNQPVISLDLNVLEDSEKRALIGSTPDKLVDLLILAHQPEPRSAPTCGTRFEILKVVGEMK
jgi:hypothetical protein